MCTHGILSSLCQLVIYQHLHEKLIWNCELKPLILLRNLCPLHKLYMLPHKLHCMKLNFLVMYQPPFVASILTFALPSVKRFLLGASLLKYSLNFCLSDLQNTICRALFSTLNVFLYTHFYRNSHLPHEPLILRSSPTEDSLLGVSDCVVFDKSLISMTPWVIIGSIWTPH